MGRLHAYMPLAEANLPGKHLLSKFVRHPFGQSFSVVHSALIQSRPLEICLKFRNTDTRKGQPFV